MNNVAARYFYQYHGLSPSVSGLCASCWGLMNLICRSMGGWLSDWANNKAGMRGRLWACWAVQTIEGVFCIILGLVTVNMDAPHSSSVGGQTIDAFAFLPYDPVRAKFNMAQGWTNLNTGKCANVTTNVGYKTISACQTLIAKLDDNWRSCLDLDNDAVSILRTTAPPTAGGAPTGVMVNSVTGEDFNCVCNSNTVGQVMLMVVFFSLCVQMAEGLHYGIVPYVSRPALGVVSGMVGAGGNLGAVISGRSFFSGWARTDMGIIYMGILIIVITALIPLIYFPEHGGMFFKAGGCGSYNPQIIKPPADYRGSDSMDYEAAKKKQAEQAGNVTVSTA